LEPSMITTQALPPSCPHSRKAIEVHYIPS
jgi:hypothetical protein